MCYDSVQLREQKCDYVIEKKSWYEVCIEADTVLTLMLLILKSELFIFFHNVNDSHFSVLLAIVAVFFVWFSFDVAKNNWNFGHSHLFFIQSFNLHFLKTNGNHRT